jgi:hypothetical protein
MAVKGYGYLKTTWSFEERPVSSSKLNLWDDRIEAALELVHFLLNQAWGGGDGVIRGAAADDLAVAATSPPGLSVNVKPGYAFVSGYPYKLAATTETADVVLPTTLPRVDLVQARVAAWDVGVKMGTASSTPVAPAPDADCIPLAELHLRVGMSVVKDTDDGTNGYIVDARQYL